MARAGAVIVAAGTGKRMGAAAQSMGANGEPGGRLNGCGPKKMSKQYIPIGGKPIVVHALEAFERTAAVSAVVLVVGAGDAAFGERLAAEYGLSKVVAVVEGGAERQHSVKNGIEALRAARPELEWVLVHDAARPLVTPEVIERTLAAAADTGAAVCAVPVKDTIKMTGEDGLVRGTPERSSLRAVQTPQAFRVGLLLKAHRRAAEDGFLGTDDAALVERLGVAVRIADGDERNVKVTTPDDLVLARNWLMEREGRRMIRIGQGFDVHAFAHGRPCIIGGVRIPFERGLAGHSDADVLLHAVADAVLGALGLGDIGRHFPDTDPAYKDADSKQLLAQVWRLAQERGYALGNADCVVIAQRPKLAPYIEEMRENIARLLTADVSAVNVKATTSEKLGFTGREEGIAAQAAVLLMRQ